MDKKLNVKYDANKVTSEELCTIPRIGKNVADIIVSKQPLSSLEDLKGLPGLGAKKLEVLAEYLTFGKTAKTTKTETVVASTEDILAEVEETVTVKTKEEKKEETPVASAKSEDEELSDLLDLI